MILFISCIGKLFQIRHNWMLACGSEEGFLFVAYPARMKFVP